MSASKISMTVKKIHTCLKLKNLANLTRARMGYEEGAEGEEGEDGRWEVEISIY